MPICPNGQRHPVDVISTSEMVATADVYKIKNARKAKSNKAKSGQAGQKARALKLSPEPRIEIAKKAASARWE
jgi:hypothetical protein